VGAAFDLGVDGYVFKSRIRPDLLEAIDVVLADGHFIPVPSTTFDSFRLAKGNFENVSAVSPLAKK
jgi:DNA-binding NarL/FixJ family response regulator